MLAPCMGGGTIAKLVDFGLHKVIDDRIKKVVKRVVSEAVIGRLGGLRGKPQPIDEMEEDDELEVALAEQRAKKVGIEAQAGATAATTSSGGGGGGGGDSRSRLSRATSRLGREPQPF